MVYIGMIYQYNEDDASGLIMLTDGKNKTFTSSEWVDKVNRPSVGQKIVYEDNKDGVSIRLACEEDIKNSSTTQKETKSVEEQIEYFIGLGFKLVKDTQSETIRTLTLRSFATGESEEVVIKDNGLKLEIIQTINGKVVSNKEG
ncbi:hypothetical protein JHD47_02870 [Sulfurimonas sp. SAG-AH-194-L11]|nr:hypothetical protein [Sulfurimonas sp. SAG-AH-194-L11]MDF1876754.1 hypothetical protein [Sulfurimonas sp. SAG-AH-194-L11]